MYKYKGTVQGNQIFVHGDPKYHVFLADHQGSIVIVTVALPEEEKLMLTAMDYYQKNVLGNGWDGLDWKNPQKQIKGDDDE